MKSQNEKLSIGKGLHPFVFTTSRDTSDMILSFDMKSGEITILEHLSGECEPKTLEIRIDDLFDQGTLSEKPLFASRLQFDPGSFGQLIHLLVEYIHSNDLWIPSDSTFAIQVCVNNFASIYGMSGDLRTLTMQEFLKLLIGMLYVAQFKIYREHLLIQESRNDPDRDEDFGAVPIVERPPEIYTVIRLNVDGLCDVQTFSSRKIALEEIQTQINEICRGYLKGMIPRERCVFPEDEGFWQTPDGFHHVFLYETELIDG